MKPETKSSLISRGFSTSETVHHTKDGTGLSDFTITSPDGRVTVYSNEVLGQAIAPGKPFRLTTRSPGNRFNAEDIDHIITMLRALEE